MPNSNYVLIYCWKFQCNHPNCNPNKCIYSNKLPECEIVGCNCIDVDVQQTYFEAKLGQIQRSLWHHTGDSNNNENSKVWIRKLCSANRCSFTVQTVNVIHLIFRSMHIFFCYCYCWLSLLDANSHFVFQILQINAVIALPIFPLLCPFSICFALFFLNNWCGGQRHSSLKCQLIRPLLWSVFVNVCMWMRSAFVVFRTEFKCVLNAVTAPTEFVLVMFCFPPLP